MLATTRSVQDRQSNYSVLTYNNGGLLFSRNRLLPPRGYESRELALWRLYYDDNSLVIRSAASGLVKKIQSTPFEITSNKGDVQHWQQFLWNAEFNAGFDTFLSRVLIPYFRSDKGGFIEVIGPGNPSDPLIVAPTGMASLDGSRCILTGNPDYPVIYQGRDGWHKMHRTRVVQIADSVDVDYEGLVGYGDCSLSRYASAARREQVMNRYIEQFLDDKPKPGIAIFKNVSPDKRNAAYEQMLREMSADGGADWGHTLILEDLAPDQPSAVDYFTFSEAPEKFDFISYSEHDIKLAALALNTDIQEIWELSGGGIGTGTQSKVLDAKSKGKAFGRLLKFTERIFNGILPAYAEFSWKWRDPEEDQQQADKANAWGAFVASVSDLLSDEIRAQILINQVEAVADAVAMLKDNEQRLDDADLVLPTDDTQEATGDEIVADVTDDDDTQEADIVDDDENDAEKSFASATQPFERRFVNLYRNVKDPLLPPAVAVSAMMNLLRERGLDVYLEGMKEAGMSNPSIDDNGRAKVAYWLGRQRVYVNALIKDFEQNEYTTDQLRDRAELWVNKSLRDLYYEAIDDSTVGGMPFLWVMDVAKENCNTCLRLNNQIHRLKTFKSRGLYPGSARLECGGWRCGCKLIPSPGMKARGNIRAVPYLRVALREHVCDHDHVCNHDHDHYPEELINAA